MYMSNAEFFGAILAMQSGDVAYWATTNRTDITDAICYRDNDEFLVVYLENNLESTGRRWAAKDFTAHQKGDYGATDSKITHFELLVQDNERTCTCPWIAVLQSGCKCGAIIPYVGGLNVSNY